MRTPLLYTILSLALVACQQKVEHPRALDIHGHRGTRGTMPENTIPGFIQALMDGAATLEMDVVMTGDGEIIVSHEPWFNPKICTDTAGQPFIERVSVLAVDMNYIRKCDCGSLSHPDFPEQHPYPASKPALWEVLAVTEKMQTRDSIPAHYNIEIKYEDSPFFPERSMLVDRVLLEVQKAGIADRTTIQSFDPTVLELVHRADSTLKTSLLLEKFTSVQEALALLSFRPFAVSPEFNGVTPDKVAQLHEMNIMCLPWTVNDPGDMRRMMDMQVDGIITDFPGTLYSFVHPTTNGSTN